MWFPHVVEAVQNQVFITVSTSKGIPDTSQQFQVVSEKNLLSCWWYYQCSEACPSGEYVDQLIIIKKKAVERKVWAVDSATLNVQWFWYASCWLKTVCFCQSWFAFETAANILFSIEAHTVSKVLSYVWHCWGCFFPFLFTNYLK